VKTLTELYRALENFDWFYERSDDHGVYRQGSAAWASLQQEARGIAGGPELLAAFITHHYSGPAWGTQSKPKPPAPKEVAGAPEQEYPNQDAERNEP
jgi:hypothetical protein